MTPEVPESSSSDTQAGFLGSVCGVVAFCLSVGSAWFSLFEAAHQFHVGAGFVEGPWFGPIALLVGGVPLYLLQLRLRRHSFSFAASFAATATICSFLFFAFWILIH